MSSNFDQRTMRDAWECWRQSEHLRDVLTTYGGREQQQAMALPRIRWEPTRDSFAIAGRGEMSIQPRPDGPTNKQSYVKTKYVRSAGAVLVMYAVDEKGIEELISRAILALEETFGAKKNCQINGGDWILARDAATNADAYALSITLEIPVVRILPAVVAETVNITTTVLQP